jgi:hypothetical protein
MICDNQNCSEWYPSSCEDNVGCCDLRVCKYKKKSLKKEVKP